MMIFLMKMVYENTAVILSYPWSVYVAAFRMNNKPCSAESLVSMGLRSAVSSFVIHL